MTLGKCRFCNVCVKTATSPDHFNGNGAGGGAWNTVPGPREEPYSFGMQNVEVRYPLLNANWRVPGPLCPLAVEYRNAVDVDFSSISLQHVATLGSRIARECGDMRMAARRIQEI